MSHVVCVLGMHRSGTSAVSRMLNLLGFDLGPDEELIPPQPANPRGFWEHRGLVALDEEILARFGGTWHEPPAFPPGWETSPALGDIEERARALLARDFTGRHPWSWKDPRACLTLPFWQTLMPPMRYVLTVRNPLDVARSLRARDGFPLDKGVALCLRHVVASLRHTAGQARLLVLYDDVVANPSAVAGSLARFVDREDAWASENLRRRLRASVEAELHHHRSTVTDLATEPDLAFHAKALYVLLHMACAERSCQGRGELGMEAWLDRMAEDAWAAQDEPARLRVRLGELGRTLADTEAAVRRLSAEAASAHARLAEMTEEVDKLRAGLRERDTHLAAIASTTGWKILDRYRRLKEESAVLASVDAWTLTPLVRWIEGRHRRT